MVFFFFNDTATTEIYTLSLHDALPICRRNTPAPKRCSPGRLGALPSWPRCRTGSARCARRRRSLGPRSGSWRSEEHTSELQSRQYLVCRLLLEKKKKSYKILLSFISFI